MLRNYLKIAWRNIVGNPLFSAINIIGLAIGLACCIMITFCRSTADRAATKAGFP